MLDPVEQTLIDYASSYYTGEEEFDRNIRLKLGHSFRVRNEARRIMSEDAVNDDRELILRAALLHDCGRFEQFKRFRTYSDIVSLDHGDLSAEIAMQRGFLTDFPPAERELILNAIRVHNKLAIPDGFSERERRIAGLVRDADKNDIMRILLRHLRNPENPAIVFSLDTVPVLTPEVADDLRLRRCPSHGAMKTRLDFLASKLNWVYDLNYPASHRIWLKRNILDELHHRLPTTPEIDELYRNALKYQKQSSLEGAAACSIR